jgi:cell division protein FtsW (lipid II flippase)
VPAGIIALPMAFILLQPDLGTAVILFLTFLSIMMLTKLKLRSFLTLVLVGVVASPPIWAYVLKQYQRDRILGFLSPSEDVLGRGWHARQSIVAIGSGEWFGKGYLQGTQNQHRFLPDQHTDLPFPVWAEEHALSTDAASSRSNRCYAGDDESPVGHASRLLPSHRERARAERTDRHSCKVPGRDEAATPG